MTDRLRAWLLALTLLVLSGAPAFAHAYLVESRPGDGDLLKQQPKQIELLFNEPVEIIAISHVDPQGAVALLPSNTEKMAHQRIDVPSNIAQGSHLVSWRVISQDGHTISGSLVFSVGRASGGAQAPTREQTIHLSTLSAPLVAARFFWLAGLVFGIGAALFASFVAPLPRGFALALLGTGALAAFIAIGLQGADAHGQNLLALNDRAIWRSGLRLPIGTAAIIAIAACAAAGLSILLGGLAARLMALLALALAGLSLAIAGHAAQWAPVELMPFLSFMHVTAAIVWAGALLPLARLTRRDNFASHLQRFSALIAPVYLILLASGIGLATTQFLGPRDLLATAWGIVLVAKLALVSLVTCTAAINRALLTKPAINGNGLALARLRRSIHIEAVLALCILAMASLWRLTPSVTALGPPNERAFQIHLHGVEAMASMSIRPARAGPVQIRIEPKAADLSPLRVEEVILHLTPDAKNAEAIRRQARRISDQQIWEVDGVTIPSPGTWRVRIDLLIDDFTRVSLDAVIAVQP